MKNQLAVILTNGAATFLQDNDEITTEVIKTWARLTLENCCDMFTAELFGFETESEFETFLYQVDAYASELAEMLPLKELVDIPAQKVFTIIEFNRYDGSQSVVEQVNAVSISDVIRTLEPDHGDDWKVNSETGVAACDGEEYSILIFPVDLSM